MKKLTAQISFIRWSIFLFSLTLLGVLLLKWFLFSNRGDKNALHPSQEILQASRGNLKQLRELTRQFPEDWECRYWLAVDLIRAEATTDELFEAGRILESIPDTADPLWLKEWKHRQFARMGLTLVESRQLPWSSDPFQEMLAKRLEQASKRIRYLTQKQVQSDLQQVKQWLTERWAYVQEKAEQTGQSIDEVFARRSEEIKPYMLPIESIQLLERFVADMSDGHTFLSGIGVARHGLPFQMRDTSDGVIVDNVLQEEKGVIKGDRITSLNNIPIDEFIQKQSDITACSTASARRAWAIRDMSNRLIRIGPQEGLLESQPSAKLEFDREGQSISVTCKLVTEDAWFAQRESVGSSWLQAKTLERGTGYLKVTSWAPESAEPDSSVAANLRNTIDDAFKVCRDSTAIIVDLRGNRGGFDWLCCYFASHFIEAPFPVYVLRFRVGTHEFENSELLPAQCGVNYKAFEGETYQGQIVVLVDENCFSASDTFINCLRSQIPKRVTLVGRPSAAGIGGPRLVGSLPHSRVSVTMSHCKVFDASGTRLLEGAPATIDCPVQWTRKDIIESRDPDLEKALALLSGSPSEL